MWAQNKFRENPKSGALEYWVGEKDYGNLDSDWTDIPGYAYYAGYRLEIHSLSAGSISVTRYSTLTGRTNSVPGVAD